MQQRQLGTFGPKVGAIGLGCMSIAGTYGPASDDDIVATLDAAFDAGITLYDTANLYGMGLSETLLGQWLTSRKRDVVVATKAGIIPGPPRRFDNSAAYLRQELEASLRRLRRDHVELYYIHRRAPDLPIEDVVGTLTRFIDEGKIAAYGLSEVSPATLRRAHAIHPCQAVQNEYSLWTRLPELGMIETCAELGTAFIPFSPLARGMFSDHPLDVTSLAQSDFRRTSPRFIEPALATNQAYIARFRRYASDLGLPTAALALAWVLDQGDHLIPIPGTRNPRHLAQIAAAADICLTDSQRTEIAKILPKGFAEGDRYSDAQAAGTERYC